jgi:hypothetical protein
MSSFLPSANRRLSTNPSTSHHDLAHRPSPTGINDVHFFCNYCNHIPSFFLLNIDKSSFHKSLNFANTIEIPLVGVCMHIVTNTPTPPTPPSPPSTLFPSTTLETFHSQGKRRKTTSANHGDDHEKFHIHSILCL